MGRADFEHESEEAAGLKVSGAGIVLLLARPRRVRGARHGRPDTHFFDRWDEGSRSEVVLL